MCWLFEIAHSEALSYQYLSNGIAVPTPIAGPLYQHLVIVRSFTVQHPPVYTYGKRGNDKDLVTSRQELERMGIAIHQTSRGGEVRYAA